MVSSFGRIVAEVVDRLVVNWLRGRVRATGPTPGPEPTGGYPGDFRGLPALAYAPHADGNVDPGEVIWGWVPFEEDYSQGKDRPVLAIGFDGPWILALPMSSKDHDADAAQERRAGRFWVEIGSGEWDRQHRPSAVRLDRIVRMNPQAVRRQGGKVSEAVFNRVADGLRQHWND